MQTVLLVGFSTLMMISSLLNWRAWKGLTDEERERVKSKRSPLLIAGAAGLFACVVAMLVLPEGTLRSAIGLCAVLWVVADLYLETDQLRESTHATSYKTIMMWKCVLGFVAEILLVSWLLTRSEWQFLAAVSRP